MTISASNVAAAQPVRGKWQTVGIMLGRGVAIFAVVTGVGILGVQHYHRVARAKKDGSGLTPTAMESARMDAGLGTQRLVLAGLDLYVTRSWETGAPGLVKGRLVQRNQSLGWEVLATAPGALPAAVQARREFAFLCFLTPNQKLVGYALNPDGHGTRITATELDLRQVARQSGGERPVPVPAGRAALMPHPPRFAMTGAESGSDMYLVVLPTGDPRAVAVALRGRLQQNGWTLEPWDAVVGADGMVAIGGEWIVAHRDRQLCHVMVTGERGEICISYRFSQARPATLEPGGA